MNPTLLDLLNQRHYAKRAEDHAIAHRRQLDGQIVELLGPPRTEAGALKDEGTVSRIEGSFKVGAAYGLDRKANDELVKRDYESMSPELRACFRFNADVNVKAIKELTPEAQVLAAAYITTKPKSVALKIDVTA